MRKRRRDGWHPGTLICTVFPILSCFLTFYVNALPLQQDSNNTLLIFNTSRDSGLVETRKLDTNDYAIKSKRKQLRQPLITQVAFDIGSNFGPIYAHITSESYDKYMNDLEAKCRTASGDNIAEMQLENLDNEYFRWEEYQFNKALLHTLFPETQRGDNRRFFRSNNVINRIRLGKGLESRCQIVEHKDDWSYRVAEKTQFEDYLINRIFQPRYQNADAQAILDEIESRNYGKVRDQVANSNLTNNEAPSGRNKRGIRKLSRQQLEEAGRIKIKGFKCKRQI